jgi:radical SAM protein with 4Fe4S-binding SPASM domain
LPDGSGSYDIAISGVKHFKEHFQGKMGSKMTMAPENITYVYDAVKNLIELKYDEIYLNCVYEKGWEPKHATELYNQFKQVSDFMIENDYFTNTYLSYFDDNGFHPMGENSNQNWCGGTGSMISVDYKGDIYPCLRYMESSIGDDIEPLIIGTVEDGFMYNDKTKQTVHDLRKITRRSQSTDECYYCPIAQLCSWCSAYNYQEFGTANKRATYICIMHKGRVLANIYYWNKGFKKYAPWFKFASWIPKEYALEIISEEEYNMLMSLIEFTDDDKALIRKMLDEGSVKQEYIKYAEKALELNRPIYTNDIDKVYVDRFHKNGEPYYGDALEAVIDTDDVVNCDKPIDYTSIAYENTFKYIRDRGFEIDALKLLNENDGDA